MIRVTHVSMSGFGVFEDPTATHIPEGRHVVLGRNRDTTAAGSNGAGKTTIFKGISWGLYGETIDRLAEPDVIHKGAKKATVKVYFEAGEKFYRVTRERTPKTGKLKLEELSHPPGAAPVADLTQTKKAATQAAIIGLLGMDWDAFRCTVLFGQGDHSRFASPTMTDAARKAVLSTVLRLGSYNEAREKAREIRAECDVSINSARTAIRDLEADIEKARRAIARHTGMIDAADSTLATIRCFANRIRAASSSPPSRITYAPSTLPAIVAKPPVMSTVSCERVRRDR